MKYLLIIYTEPYDPTQSSPEDVAGVIAAHGAFGEAAEKAGVFVAGDGLQPPSTATTVRVRDGERLLTDGPFAETKEQLGGYYMLDCKDLDEAISWAERVPEAKYGSIEVRPVMDYEAVEKFAKSGAGAAAS